MMTIKKLAMLLATQFCFPYCYGLTSVDIPNSVTSIGDIVSITNVMVD